MRITAVMAIIFLGPLALSATNALADEEIYRWTDENGVVHFGNQPPAQAGAEQVVIPQSHLGDSPVASKPEPTDLNQAEEPEVSYAQQRRDERAKRREEAEEIAKITAEACEQRRTLVSQMEPSPRVIVKDDDGTVRRLDDNERLEILSEAKTFIAENCDN